MNPPGVKSAAIVVALVALTVNVTGCKKDEAAAAAEDPATAADPGAGTGTAAPAEPAPPEPADDPDRDLRWEAVSADGTAVLTQVAVGGKCRRSCTDSPGKEVWSADGCIGKRIDLRFVANDCGKAIVLHQLPETTANSSAWPSVEVGHVYSQGKLDYAIAAGGAVRKFDRIRSAGNTFYWLAGALNQPGRAPRYSEDGTAVMFETLDGGAHSIPLTAK